jgi:hypothetical protein
MKFWFVYAEDDKDAGDNSGLSSKGVHTGAALHFALLITYSTDSSNTVLHLKRYML